MTSLQKGGDRRGSPAESQGLLFRRIVHQRRERYHSWRACPGWQRRSPSRRAYPIEKGQDSWSRPWCRSPPLGDDLEEVVGMLSRRHGITRFVETKDGHLGIIVDQTIDTPGLCEFCRQIRG